MKVEFDEECPSCHGTGLYVGCAEHDGAAVVCSTCKGTGKHHFVHEYDEFTVRKDRPKVTRVFEANPGIGIGKNDTLELSDFGGMPYQDWKQNKPFPEHSEMRKFTCPAWWYQTVDYKKKPRWEECIGCGAFSDCKYFSKKEDCWMCFDMEHE